MSGDYYTIGVLDDAVGADQHVAIRFKDTAAVVAKEGGKLGALAARLAPETVESEVYRRMVDEIEKDLRGRGFEADVKVVRGLPGAGGKVVETVQTGDARGAFWRGAGAGAGGAALLYVLARVIRALFLKG